MKSYQIIITIILFSLLYSCENSDENDELDGAISQIDFAIKEDPNEVASQSQIPSNAIECKSFEDQKIWNDFHKQHLGEVVFSAEKITHDTPDASLIKTIFNIEQPIKGRLYLQKSLFNYYYDLENSNKYPKGTWCTHGVGKIGFQMSINGKVIKTAYLNMANQSAQTWTTVYYDFINQAKMFAWNTHQSVEMDTYFHEAIQSLNPGTHQVSIVFYPLSPYTKDKGNVFAKGSFILQFTEDEKNSWIKSYGQSDVNTQSTETSTENNETSEDSNQSDYVVIINDCGDKVEFAIDPSGVQNDYLSGGGKTEISMKQGDKIRLLNSGVVYTHISGNKGPVYICK
jgi:hypothetical protein